MSKQTDVVVAGGGGFIGGHLVGELLAQGKTVRSIDIKPPHEWYQLHQDAENVIADLSLLDSARAGVQNARQVYMLAADMGGMGFIENNKAACMMSVLTSTHMLQAAHEAGVERYFYSSSACVYAADKQTDPNVTALKEEDAYPAQPEDGYGWEKLFSERMSPALRRGPRVHHSRGPLPQRVRPPRHLERRSREGASTAVCRKVAEAVVSGDHRIDIWGDGQQSRSFMYIDDCLHGTQMIMHADSGVPVNLGSSELVTINQLVDIVEQIAGIRCERTYQLDAPQGVRGRNSDNKLIREIYGWEPSISLLDGLEKTYAWVYDQVKRSHQ